MLPTRTFKWTVLANSELAANKIRSLSHAMWPLAIYSVTVMHSIPEGGDTNTAPGVVYPGWYKYTFRGIASFLCLNTSTVQRVLSMLLVFAGFK